MDSSSRCIGTTKSGVTCRKRAVRDGYCSLHADQYRSPAQKRFDRVLQAIENACDIKGWSHHHKPTDPEFRLGTISIEKWFDDGTYTGNKAKAIIEVHIKPKSVQYSLERVSGRLIGNDALMEAIKAELSKAGYGKNSGEERAGPEGPELCRKILTRLLGNFDKFVRQLRRRQRNRKPIEVEDEYDVQDLLHSLLRAYFEDVRAEEPSPSRSGASSRLDFLLKAERTVVEVKVATDRLRSKEIGEQLIVDINRYKGHPDCEELFCLVYDTNANISNPSGLERDLSGKHDGLQVTVVVTPK